MSDWDDNLKFWQQSWFLWSLVVGMTLATCAVLYSVQPWFTARETENTRSSLSYVSTHQGILRQFKTAYDGVNTRIAETPDDAEHQELRAALATQRRSLVLQMRQEADLIPHDVPSDVREVLR